MTTAELHRRNEAIALVDGWEKIDRGQMEPAYHRGEWMQYITQFSYDRSWNALMPVVEKIQANPIQYHWIQIGDATPYTAWCAFFSPERKAVYFWKQEEEDKYNEEGVEINIVESMKQAYFLAVSDYCLSLIKTP